MQLLKSMVCFHCTKPLCWLCLLLLFNICDASTQYVGQIHPGLEGFPMTWVDHHGWFLLSNHSTFSLGFFPALEANMYMLLVLHGESSTAVWTANRGFPIGSDCKFVFDRDGNAYLGNATDVVWSTNTSGRGVTAMELQETGNLVLLGGDRRIIWQSFSHPTDTLLSGQEFVEGMKLKSFPYHTNLFHYLEIKGGDLILYAGYQTPQVYWSMAKDSRKTISKVNGKVSSASLIANSWNFYDQNKTLVCKFNFSDHNDPNATWAAVLGTDGTITFHNLQVESSLRPEPVRIPPNSCSTPEPCNPYNVCSFDNRCQCPSALRSLPNCSPQLNSPCNSSEGAMELLSVGKRLDYFALEFVNPLMKTNLSSCQEACRRNCSCVALFFQFQDNSGKCFLFDHIGSLKRADFRSVGFVSYVKVIRSDGDSNKNGRKHVVVVIIIAVATVVAFVGLLYLGYRITQKKKKSLEPSKETLEEEDNFLETVSGMPVRFSYNDLCNATKDFSMKLGQGGFGSVYQGVLLDGTRVAVKKLERIGQGMKEFRAEVSIIGSIHHVHLVRLKGFCAEGIHRLLVYEYMGKGSLDRWLFRKDGEVVQVLDWDTRFSIALGMAKGLAYLHEECDVKIVHCDIKPENVLLDDKFLAKVSDFGLAKLMGREQSHVFTEVRGTRGYLAPEWLTNYPISEKSDVFSFGMVVMELIGGRKNYIPEETSEKAHFPSYAFKMMEEGKLKEILDPKLEIDENYDERVATAMKVALWCIQDDMQMRPPMTKVVQMLQGICDVPVPPTSNQVSSCIYSSFFKSSSEGTSSEFPNCNSVAIHSDVQLSGPR